MIDTIEIPVLQTERLRLRGPKAADFDSYSQTLMSDRARYAGGPFAFNDAWIDFAKEAAGWVLQGYGSWAIEDKATGAFLGMVILQKPAFYPEHEIGWMLQAEAEGKGYACEAATAARDWAWANLNWPSMVSYIDDGNTRSIRLAERLGAVRDPDAPTPWQETCLVYRHPTPEALQ